MAESLESDILVLAQTSLILASTALLVALVLWPTNQKP